MDRSRGVSKHITLKKKKVLEIPFYVQRTKTVEKNLCVCVYGGWGGIAN